MRKNQDNFIPYYNQFKNKIYNYFLYRVGFDKSLAEDLTSEVFVKALKSFDDFDESIPYIPTKAASGINQGKNRSKLRRNRPPGN